MLLRSAEALVFLFLFCLCVFLSLTTMILEAGVITDVRCTISVMSTLFTMTQNNKPSLPSLGWLLMSKLTTRNNNNTMSLFITMMQFQMKLPNIILIMIFKIATIIIRIWRRVKINRWRFLLVVVVNDLMLAFIATMHAVYDDYYIKFNTHIKNNNHHNCDSHYNN